MFSTLFEANDDVSDQTMGHSGVGKPPASTSSSLPVPNPPRHSNKLCGIYNQGATCYLNSLLQTLFLTPEFREQLFQLNSDQLGKLEDKNKPNAKVRKIPLQLQRLFARMLLCDQQGVSTSELTDSFGWRDNEAFQQHDVQELNRILFNAIEDSLIGTKGASLIKNLYHGEVVNQIICQECHYKSERKEDFLDLCMSVIGVEDLHAALCEMYINTELMEGNNQYRCGKCQKLVNASKGAKIRRLPPILSFSLLRFSFDFVRMERYKEIGKFAFPVEIDMKDFCDETVEGDTEYELYSVVIHRGSTHGGHYHAYIRDVDSLGKWTPPEKEEIIIPTDPATGKVDYITLESPIELVQAILSRADGGLTLDKLCSEMTKQTGTSWNKRFKKQYGPINKFLNKYNDKFVYDQQTNLVVLKSYSETKPVENGTENSDKTLPEEDCSSNEDKEKEIEKKHDERNPSQENLVLDAGDCWYDFDDSRVKPISSNLIESQFSGKESAYMLFYRSKSLKRPQEARGNPLYGLPEHLHADVVKENCDLTLEREKYEDHVNNIFLTILSETEFIAGDGALHPVTVKAPPTLNFDRRRTVKELITGIYESIEVDYLPPREGVQIHLAKQIPAGYHLYEHISQVETEAVMKTKVCNNSVLFLWNGKNVKGTEILTGEEHEPILLEVTYGNPGKFMEGFPKSMTLGEFRINLSNKTMINKENLLISLVRVTGSQTRVLTLYPNMNDSTLGDLKLWNGDQITAEDSSHSGHSLAETTASKQAKIISFLVENRCFHRFENNYPVAEVQIDRKASVEELKTVIISQICDKDTEVTKSRLRIEDDTTGLGPPLQESQSISAANLTQGMKLVLEPGEAPKQNQMTLSFSSPNSPEMEILVDSMTTVEECLAQMLSRVNFKDSDWHLRKTNWQREADQVLDDMGKTLVQCQIKNGDYILLEKGRLPPKGFIKLDIYHMKPAESGYGVLSSISNVIQGLSSAIVGSGNGDTEDTLKNVDLLGDLIIERNVTLEALREKIIIEFDGKSSLVVPTPDFMRVRHFEDDKPSTILRGPGQTMQKLKVVNGSKLCVQVLQEEENLNENQLLLNIQLRDPLEETKYKPSEEWVWELTKHNAGASGLKQCIADHFNIPVKDIAIAKHLPEKFEWKEIKETNSQKSGKQNNKKNKAKKQNLKHDPYRLKDGDTIGVRDMDHPLAKTDDFMTPEDKAGKEKLREEAEEKRKKREASKNGGSFLDSKASGDGPKRRSEVGIKIHVDKFD